MDFFEYDGRLKPQARGLRKSMTNAEQVLWYRLRRKQLAGIQFYRQKPLLQYIVDFYAPKVMLVVEVDGARHQDDARQRYLDGKRTALLELRGLTVLRFDDRQVLTEIDGVLGTILAHINERSVRRNRAEGASSVAI
jgi:very-short-patch-repair endonuclease